MNYRQHKKAWKDCKRCALHKRRTNVVLLRGKIPCDVLFVGEAPGVSEDVLGVPFIGPAGKLLDRIIVNTKEYYGNTRIAFTNLVACVPKDSEGNKTEEPKHSSILRCAGRLQQIIEIADPQTIIAVGKLAKKYIIDKPTFPLQRNAISVIHPAAILRLDVSQQSLAVHRVVVQLQRIFTEIAKGKTNG